MKTKNSHTVRTVPKSNRKIVDRRKMYTPYTHIHPLHTYTPLTHIYTHTYIHPLHTYTRPLNFPGLEHALQ